MRRVALLGYGLAGRVLHRPLIQSVEGLTITNVVTADPGRVAQAHHDLPSAAVVADARLLWARADEFDVVVVATANPSHLPLASASLRLGKTTVVDKPLAVTAAEGQSLVDLAARHEAQLTVFQNRRWDSDTLSAADLLARDALGSVLRLESRFTRFRPEVVPRWREDAAAGGGVLLDLGSHLVDQAVHLLGPAVDVYAELDTRREGAGAEDDCFLALTHACGARSHLWCSLAAPYPGPRLVLQGSRAGWAKQDLDNQEDALRAEAAPAPEPDGLLWSTEGLQAVPSATGDWAAFYRAIAAGGPPPVDPAEAVAVLRVLESARTSARTRQVVALPG